MLQQKIFLTSKNEFTKLFLNSDFCIYPIALIASDSDIAHSPNWELSHNHWFP